MEMKKNDPFSKYSKGFGNSAACERLRVTKLFNIIRLKLSLWNTIHYCECIKASYNC